MRQPKREFLLGNILRGWFSGEFLSADEAWKYLSRRFLLSYPAKAGRSVSLYVYEPNQYGESQWLRVKLDITWRGNA